MPHFFAHEGKVLDLLSGRAVPGLIAHENGRILLAEIPGEDFYEGATPDQFRAMIALLVDIQASFIGRENELLTDGLPDFRTNALAAAMPHVLDQTRADLSPEDFATLEKFQTDLPQIARAIDECGIPATLIHGDFHPGNVRGTGTALTLLDWGDSGVGHPLLDQTALLRHVADSDKAGIETCWHGAWQQRIPGSNPARAATLIKPVAALHQAVIRQTFIDNIEPTEHFYCLAKRASWLARAAELYRAL